MGPHIAENTEIPAAEYRRAERLARTYIHRNYPAYKDNIVSIGGSPRGKFLLVYVAISADDAHKVYVPISQPTQ
jgi:hypothetical protein